MPFNMLHTYDPNWLHFNSAGWLGNDPLTVVIGESDPYVHITGRVSISNFLTFYNIQLHVA
jgi:hypothetical protein